MPNSIPSSTSTRASQGLDWTLPDPLFLEIKTPRLVIRPFVLADIEPLFDAINASRKHLLPWLPWARTDHQTIEATTHFVASQILSLCDTPEFQGVALGIFDRTTFSLLGGTGLHNIRRDTASGEIGYWIAAQHVGNGYVTEATAHLISYALAPQDKQGFGLARIVLYCSGANQRSIAIPTRLELRQEVCQKNDYFIQGIGPTDRLGWGVLADEWDCTQHRLRTC